MAAARATDASTDHSLQMARARVYADVTHIGGIMPAIGSASVGGFLQLQRFGVIVVARPPAFPAFAAEEQSSAPDLGVMGLCQHRGRSNSAEITCNQECTSRPYLSVHKPATCSMSVNCSAANMKEKTVATIGKRKACTLMAPVKSAPKL